MEFHIVDTETAGLTGGVCEIAWLVVDKDLNILDKQVHRTNPERPIDPKAQEIHGISDADVAMCPTLAEVCQVLPDPLQWIGHNSSFDLRMTKGVLSAKRSLCTLALSRQYIKGTTSHKLATLQEELNLPKQTSHSALGDVLTTRDLLLHILPLTGVDLETLFQRADEPKILAKMPFGKHKGVTMVRVPPDYREWLLAQGDLDKDLQFTLEKLKNI